MQFGESPYRVSAFRILGQLASVPCADLARAVQLYKHKLANADPSEVKELELAFDLPWLRYDKITNAELQSSLSALFRGESRWLARLFWFHKRDDIDGQALKALERCEFGHAHNIWRTAWNTNKTKRGYLHNLAVLHHSRVLANPRGSALLLKDLQESMFCWGFLLNSKRSTLVDILLEGEESPTPEMKQVVEQVAQRECARIYEELTRTVMRLLPALGGMQKVRILNFAEPITYLGAEILDNTRTQLSIKYRFAVERARSCARRRDYVGVESAIDEARQYCLDTGMDQQLSQTAKELRLKVLQFGLQPLAKQPHLVEKSGLGIAFINTNKIDPLTRSFEGDLIFRFCYVPIYYFGHYRVAQDHDEKLTFLGKHPTGSKYMIWNGLVLLAVIVFILGMTRINFKMLDRHNAIVSSAFDNGIIMVGVDEINEMNNSVRARGKIRMKASNSLRQLEERKDELENTIVPQRRARLSNMPPAASEEAREKASEELQEAQDELATTKKNIEATQDLLKYIKDVEAAL